MGLGEASASHGQDEQDAEDVREVPTGWRQDKQGAEDFSKVPGGCGQDLKDPGGARQAPAGHRQGRVGPEPPQAFQDTLDQGTISQLFLCSSGIEYIQEIHLDQEM